MLASLKIENVAVIEKAEVNFTPGFNVLTGETGAGKSILIDSINAILGNRTSRELVRSGAQKACIWATFESIPDSVKKQLEKCGYEVTDDLLLYREINAEGKGSCRVNGMPATAAVHSAVKTRQRLTAVPLTTQDILQRTLLPLSLLRNAKFSLHMQSVLQSLFQ